MALHPYISLFSGSGGLDLAVRLALPEARCLCYVENEITAARILAARIAEGSLDDAPIWSDVRTFPGDMFRGRVAGVAGGFPCPDYSVAGRRAGIIGKHGQLWNHMREVIRVVEPEWVFLENVPGILNAHKINRWRCTSRDLFGRTIWSRYSIPAGIGFVLGDLAEMGFDIQWGCLPASAMGAAHKRERWFALAYREGARSPLRIAIGDGEKEDGRGWSDVGKRGRGMADAAERGRGILREPSRGDGFVDGSGADVADASGERRQQITRCASGDESQDERRASDGADESASGFGDVGNTERTERWQSTDGQGDSEPGNNGEGEAASRTGERSEAVGDTTIAGHGESRLTRGRELPAQSGGGMDRRSQQPSGHAIGKGLEIGRCEPGDAGEECEAAERAGEPLDYTKNSECERLEEETITGEQRVGGVSGVSLPIFAPGPSDPCWPDLLVRFPWLRPAIAQAEAESTLRGMADGLADLVVRDRTDALRAIGNGVVPLQAAAMFRELTRRAR